MMDFMVLADRISQEESRGEKDVKRFSSLIETLPKAEIHIHVESLITPADLLILNEKYKIYPDCHTQEELKEALGIKKIANLGEMIQQFLNIQSFVRSEEDFALIGESIRPYMERNNIVYLEGHLAVSSFVKRDFDFNRMMLSLDKSLAKIARETGRESAILIDVSRTFGPENAMRNLDLLLAYLEGVKESRIIGIGLGGAEKSGLPELYGEVFAKAHAAGLRCVAHAGEESPPTQITDTLTYLNPERIGHGLSAFQSEELMNELVQSQLALEVCPTSNLFIKAFVDKMEDHPIALMLKKGIFVTLNTDDPLLFEVELNGEYEAVYKGTDLSFSQMLILLTNTVKASFMEDEAKKALLDEIGSRVSRFLS
jgi:adenosine deaminase